MERGLRLALGRGSEVLERGGSALDAAVAAVSTLEDEPSFNAGRGSVLRSDGGVRMDASVMLGEGQRAGAVSLVQTVQNPVQLARYVMERGREVLIMGADAEELARAAGLSIHAPGWFLTPHRTEQLERLRGREAGMALDHDVPAMGGPSAEEGQTVGAVALDTRGHLAAATSTGGMTNASPGRVGDSPIIGAGTWASDETCAVSATGSGEFFIRAAFAHGVHCRMAWTGSDLQQATRSALDEVVRLGGHGGCVALDATGRICMPFTTLAMPRACRSVSGACEVYVLGGAPAPGAG
jgi:beta-aspartyl-peptidase (threonine type)